MPAKPAKLTTAAVKAQGKNNPISRTSRWWPRRVRAAASPVAVTKPITKPKRRSEQYTAEGKKAPRTPVDLPAGYKPGKPGAKESYMNDFQLEYFRRKLLTWREELVEESKQTIDNLREEVRDVGDEAERATRETENSLELRTRDRYRKLIGKIDKALRRIEDGEYGYCEETGEEIGLDRLEARPIATLCLDAQERWEHRQRQMGD
jgi:DnaK suppressor protein